MKKHRPITIGTAIIVVVAIVLQRPISCRAGNVVEVNANPGTNAIGIGGEFQQVAAVSWTTSQTFTNLTIQAAVATANPNDTATAYLTTAAGPGATPSDVVAESTFTLPISLPEKDAPDFTIFTNLTLDAGTYYLILTSAFDTSRSRGWRGTFNTPDVILAPGVTLDPMLLSSDTASDPNFAPDSKFSVTPFSYQFAVFSVPEPSSFLLLSAAGLTLAARQFRRRRSAS